MSKSVEADVRAFMLAVGQINADTNIAKRPSHELLILRAKLIREEFKETMDAIDKLASGFSYENQAEVLDGLCDIVYVTVGAAIALGLPFTEAWNEVQRSNMAKIHPDGTVKRREDGKVLKPEGWTPPDLWNIVKAAHDTEVQAHEQWGVGKGPAT